MEIRRRNLILGLGVMLAAVLACSGSMSTANIRSLKVASDQDGKNEKDTFGPGDKVYGVGEIANNGGKVKVKFRLLNEDVKGETAGTLVQSLETSLDVDGNATPYYVVTLPPAGFPDGKYKFEMTMLNEEGVQKDQKTATFNVKGF